MPEDNTKHLEPYLLSINMSTESSSIEVNQSLIHLGTEYAQNIKGLESINPLGSLKTTKHCSLKIHHRSILTGSLQVQGARLENRISIGSI